MAVGKSQYRHGFDDFRVLRVFVNFRNAFNPAKCRAPNARDRHQEELG